MQIHKFWQWLFSYKHNKSITIAEEKALNIVSYVQDYSEGWDGASKAGRVAAQHSYSRLYLWSSAQSL